MEARTYTSNTAKLLKHLPMLTELQQSGDMSPVMVHIAPTNICNLECEYCCYGGRILGQHLTLEQVRQVLIDFWNLGTRAVEWTGGGEPTLFRDLDSACQLADSRSMKQGLITNAIKFDWFHRFDLLQWMRVSFHGFNEGKGDLIAANICKAKEANPKLEISAVYIWTKDSDLVYPVVSRFAEEARIPTRVTPDLTAGAANIDSMMLHVGRAVERNPHSFTFLSDFNVKTERKHDHCYMHAVKPFVFPDGWVYPCPSIGLTPETAKNVLEEFRVCRIEDIAEFYGKPMRMRHHACSFCKYSAQNELVDDILLPTQHNEFA